MVTPAPALRIAFFGTPDFAVPSLAALLGSRHAIVGVVTQPDRPRGRGQHVTESPVKQRAGARGLAVLQPDRLKDPAFLDALRAWAPDLGVVAAYGKILPEAVLALPRLGLVNVHASLLPRHRGAAPVHRAVMAGDRETGVSIMHVVQALDAGPVYAVARCPIAPEVTSTALEEELARIGADALLPVVDDLALGIARAVPQDDALATYAPRLRKEEGVLDWSADAAVLHDRIRGLQPWPMAWTHLGGRRLLVVQSRIAPGAVAPGTPGEVVAVSADALTVRAGNGRAVDVLAVQPEGRRVMSVREFVAGHRLAPGARFEGPPAAADSA